MVTSKTTKDRSVIVARPNLSATWQTNKLVLWCLGGLSLAIAGGFAVLGAWPVLPFAGLEILWLGTTLYYVNWKLQYRHVITLENDTVRVEKGYYVPREVIQLARRMTALTVLEQPHPWDGPLLYLHDRHRQIQVGEFLNREERGELLALLRREFRVAGHSTASQRHF